MLKKNSILQNQEIFILQMKQSSNIQHVHGVKQLWYLSINWSVFVNFRITSKVKRTLQFTLSSDKYKQNVLYVMHGYTR